MRPGHILLALATVMTWGFNYAVIAWGLQGVPPVLLAVLRFAFAAFPLVFFVKRPRAPWPWLAGHALAMFALQFGFLFVGIASGMPAGLASLVIQCQAFFTMVLAARFLGEPPRPVQVIGACVALAGIVLVGAHVGGRASLLGFALVIGAGFCWGLGNLCTKRMGEVDVMGLVAWNSLLALPLLMVAALVLEGPSKLALALAGVSWKTAAVVLFQAYAATVFCFGAWSYLMHRYPTATVAPFSLLVPVFGMLSGVLLLGEPMAWWKGVAALLVVGGLALTQLEERLSALLEWFDASSEGDSNG